MFSRTKFKDQLNYSISPKSDLSYVWVEVVWWWVQLLVLILMRMASPFPSHCLPAGSRLHALLCTSGKCGVGWTWTLCVVWIRTLFFSEGPTSGFLWSLVNVMRSIWVGDAGAILLWCENGEFWKGRETIGRKWRISFMRFFNLLWLNCATFSKISVLQRLGCDCLFGVLHSVTSLSLIYPSCDACQAPVFPCLKTHTHIPLEQ